MSDRMSVYFSLFNCHLNNAKERADREFIAQFGLEKFKEEIEPFILKGIMSIFDKEPNFFTFAYTVLVTAYVNEGR
jgi:hypothetical protein